MNTNANQVIFVGLSGGVDSSVSAYLLKEQGYQVEAVFMKNWEDDDDNTQCSQETDLTDAQAVADKLEIPLHVVNFANEYWQSVFSHFLDEYRAGRTPNPDILCNKEIKFKAFLDYALQKGANAIATGHYVQRKEINNHTYLVKGADPNKDQSYFLHALTEDQISQCLFPIGHLEKSEVRRIAEHIGLVNFNKKDSTGICFIGEKKFKSFLNEYLPAKPGKIMSIDGEHIGQHQGLMFHTIGQRQGLEIGGIKGKAESPWYVIEKDLKNNQLIVAQGNQHQGLFKTELKASQMHWINQKPAFPLNAKAKTRYRQPDQKCEIVPIENDCYLIRFESPQRAITPGQSVVIYQDDICLGGGIIE